MTSACFVPSRSLLPSQHTKSSTLLPLLLFAAVMLAPQPTWADDAEKPAEPAKAETEPSDAAPAEAPQPAKDAPAASAEEKPAEPPAKSKPPEPTPEELIKQAQALEAQAAKRRAEEEAAREQIQNATQSLRELELQLSELRRKVEETMKTVGETETKLKTEQEQAAKEEAAKKQADEALAVANKALAEAKKKADEAQAAATAAAKKHQDQLAAVQKTNEMLASLKKTIETASQGMKDSEQKLTGLQQQIAMAEATASQARTDWVEIAKQSESLLARAGQWVSFTHEIAPIFYQRCLACHNARTAKGRYNMESFSAIMKGGESGAAVEPGDSDLSTLCIMVEDGSMPKDADPLTPEQISSIAKWVKLGAKLDAGVDPNAPLIKIMPKFPQPEPPETYHVAIPITALAYSPDGSLLASSGYHEVLIWSAKDGSLVRRITNIAERTYDITFHPDGKRIAVASGTPGQLGEVKLFQVEDGTLLADLVTAEDAMFGVAFSPDGNRLAVCGADRSIRIYDVASNTEQHLIEDHADWVLDIAWSPDGSKLVSASRDKTSKLFDATSGDALVTFNGHGDVVTSAAFLADGNSVVSSGRDRQLRVWNVSDAKEQRRIGGFGNEITELFLLADGRVFTASADRKARAHNVGDGKALKSYDGHTDWIYSVTVHPDSGAIATGAYDGEIRIWSIEEGKTTVQWTAAPGHASNAQASAAP